VHHDPDTAALRFERVTLVRGDATVLHEVDWRVDRSDRWVVLGPNGAGKTSIMALCTGYLHPTRGTVTVLGGELGRIDVRHLRERIGMISASIAQQLRPTLPAVDVVMTAKYGALEPWWHDYEDADRARARALLADAGFGYTADREFGVLSEGERKQVLLARAQMHEPDLLLLDEPMAGVDLGGRENLVRRLDEIGRDPTAPPIVFVTHHVEEIPPSFTHVLLLRGGEILAKGAIDECMNADTLSVCFDIPLELARRDRRWQAWAKPS